MTDSKNALRRHLRQRRRDLPPRILSQAAEAVARQLSATSIFRRSRRIAAYLAVGGELDLAPLLQRALAHGKQVYLPCLAGRGAPYLLFRRYRGPSERMRRNRFGILEPARGPLLGARQLDLVLAPLVAFDGRGNRLGMGGGFYDRTFAFLPQRLRWRKPRLIGVAYSFQEVPELVAEPWDVGLWACVTERGMRYFARP